LDLIAKEQVWRIMGCGNKSMTIALVSTTEFDEDFFVTVSTVVQTTTICNNPTPVPHI